MSDTLHDRPPRLWAPRAWIDGGWRESVVLDVDASGHWHSIDAGQPAPADATVLPGPAVPGLVNAHSHAFQRAFAGQAERRTADHDDFWSWRDRMYGVALTITPARLREVARTLYRELLAGGFTQVCEFHYLHHDPDGRRYPEPAAMAEALIAAAADTGIGLTLLPVLYERAGFAAPALRADQRRFAADAGFVLELREAVSGAGSRPGVQAGVAIHSLRAAPAASIDALLARLARDAAPIHVHVAEQTAEVDDCLAAHGARPIEWLCRRHAPDARWQLVHATHATPAEIEAVAACGAGVVICPSTEANLGDGVPDLPRWLAAGVPIAIGTDSHVGRAANAELRWLEYAQRLLLRHRNVVAEPARWGGSTAAVLFERCLAGGAAAAGLGSVGAGGTGSTAGAVGLRRGARADLVVLDTAGGGLDLAPAADALDAWVFATDTPAVAQTWVAGRRVV